MTDYKEALENIQKTLLRTSDLIKDSYLQNIDLPSAIKPLQESIRKIVDPCQQLAQPILSESLNELVQIISKEPCDILKPSFELAFTSGDLSDSVRHMIESCISSNIPGTIESLKVYAPEDLCSRPANDFVTVNESIIKEYDIPDTIAIPIGHGRIRIKTSDFISILGIIASIIVAISIAVIQSKQSSTATEIVQMQSDEIQTRLLQSQNQMFCLLLHDIDLSFSSQAEALQSLKETVEAQNTAISDLGESLDSIQQLTDNMKSSENTASENK